MHISLLRDYPRELDNFEKLTNSLPMWRAFFRHNFLILSLKHLRCRPCAKVACQIPEGSDCFGCLIPRVCSPHPPSPFWGKTLDRCIEFKFYLKLPLVFHFDYPFWTSLRTRCDSLGLEYNKLFFDFIVIVCHVSVKCKYCTAQVQRCFLS